MDLTCKKCTLNFDEYPTCFRIEHSMCVFCVNRYLLLICFHCGQVYTGEQAFKRFIYVVEGHHRYNNEFCIKCYYRFWRKEVRESIQEERDDYLTTRGVL